MILIPPLAKLTVNSMVQPTINIMVTMVTILYKHYGHDGYHLLVLFDGNTSDVLKGELRSGNVYTSRQVVKFIGSVLKNYGKVFHQETPFYLRADSGLSKPGLYRTCGEIPPASPLD